jgi:outer membrane protein assembly factor BamA
VEGNFGLQRYSYDLEQRTSVYDSFGFFQGFSQTSLPSPDAINLVSASVALVGDRSNIGFTSPISGGRFRLEVGQSVGTVNFTSLVLDVRRYFSPSNSITFAARALHFGRYGKNLDTDRTTATIQPYFLGYETFIRGYAFESFQPGECASSALEPGAVVGSCPGFDRLFGHRLGVLNFEIRTPLFGNERIGLFNFPYLPTEIFVFGDAGLAVNDFSEVRFEFSRSGGARVPVFSTGFGARFNLFGFLILEAYRAYPFQRPDRGAHWGFLLAPGW